MLSCYPTFFLSNYIMEIFFFTFKIEIKNAAKLCGPIKLSIFNKYIILNFSVISFTV